MTDSGVTAEFLPCPGCGGVAQISDNGRGIKFHAYCTTCGRVGAFERCAIDARDVWNKEALAMRKLDPALAIPNDEGMREKCIVCPDWTAWEKDVKKAAVKDASPISDEDLNRFRYALADVHCKSSSAKRHEVEYRLQRFGAKMWRKILARLDQAEALVATPSPVEDDEMIERVADKMITTAAVSSSALGFYYQNLDKSDWRRLARAAIAATK